MLFDDRDLSVFDNVYEKDAFREVIQTYYSGNYRAAVVTLYSLVMFDLYNKLQYMAEEGEKKAQKELEKVNKLIEDDEKYSAVEKEVFTFFTENYSLHFSNFERDIKYLKESRDNCAHLKVNSQTLSVPKDYQVRMLISSMFENLFSVKAPFLDDLLPYVKDDIEEYSADETSILSFPIEDSIHQRYSKKFFSRMTQTSLLKSLRTILRLLFVSEDEEAVKYSRGLYIILRSMLHYIDAQGLGSVCENDDKVLDVLMKVDEDSLNLNPIRKDALYITLCSSRWLCDSFRKNELFKGVVDQYIFKRNVFEKHFKILYPELHADRWNYYKENYNRFPCKFQKSRFDYLKDAEGFSDVVFIECEIDKVPTYYGFDDADSFMGFLDESIESISDDAIKLIIEKYNSNNQFYDRRSSKAGVKLIMTEVEKRKMNIDWSQYKAFSRYTDTSLKTSDNDESW